jgi:hypothetical protein
MIDTIYDDAGNITDIATDDEKLLEWNKKNFFLQNPIIKLDNSLNQNPLLLDLSDSFDANANIIS